MSFSIGANNYTNVANAVKKVQEYKVQNTSDAKEFGYGLYQQTPNLAEAAVKFGLETSQKIPKAKDMAEQGISLAQNIPALQEAMEEYSLDKNSEIQNSLTEAYKKVLDNSFTSTYIPSILPTEDGSTNSINKDSVLIDGKIYEVKTGQKTNSGFCSLAPIKGEYVEIDGKQYDVINVPDTNSTDGTKKAIVYDGKTYYVGNSLNLQAQQAFKQVFSNAFEKLFSQE